MVKEMCAAIDLARQDNDVRVLIITGKRTRVLRRRRYQRSAGEPLAVPWASDGTHARDGAKVPSAGDLIASLRQAGNRRD